MAEATEEELVNKPELSPEEDKGIKWNFLENTLNPMIKRKEAINRLRTQKKSSTVDFLPSNAYALLGHGDEPINKSFIVPANCIIIAKAFPGEATYYHNLYRLWNTLFDSQRTPIYENPLCYMSEIINDFGSVMVYKPGDMCPDFKYVLRPNKSDLNLVDGRVPDEDIRIRRLPINKYGLINIRNLPDFKIESEIFRITSSVGKFISKFYDKSITPTTYDFLVNLDIRDTPQSIMNEHDISKRIKEIKAFHEAARSEIMARSLKDTINYIESLNSNTTTEFPMYSDTSFPMFPDVSSTSQSELCEIYPGVYYNFICRVIKGSKNVYETDPNSIKKVIKPSIKSILHNNLPLRSQNILKRRILEAEQRKHFLPGSKFNRSAATARRRKSRKQRRTRKSRK